MPEQNQMVVDVGERGVCSPEDVLKTSSEEEDERRFQDVFKTNVCWDTSTVALPKQ